MPKVFNTAAICIPQEHYMVNLDSRVREIKKLVDAGKYFTINRARQYGKTTTLRALYRNLMKDYYVVSLDFPNTLQQAITQAPDSVCAVLHILASCTHSRRHASNSGDILRSRAASPFLPSAV